MLKQRNSSPAVLFSVLCFSTVKNFIFLLCHASSQYIQTFQTLLIKNILLQTNTKSFPFSYVLFKVIPFFLPSHHSQTLWRNFHWMAPANVTHKLDVTESSPHLSFNLFLNVSSTVNTINYALLEIRSLCLFDPVFLIFSFPILLVYSFILFSEFLEYLQCSRYCASFRTKCSNTWGLDFILMNRNNLIRIINLLQYQFVFRKCFLGQLPLR